jgi:tetratricopeptide (TPR) repeat protein
VPRSSLPAWQQLASLRPSSSRPGGAPRSGPPAAASIPSTAPPPLESLDEAAKLRRAEQLAERRNYADATRIIDDLIACDPKNADFLAMRAYILYQQFAGGQPPRSLLDAIAAALRMNEEQPRALYVKGLVFKRIGKPHEALRYFQRALDADPHHIEAQRELRLARMRRDR